MNGSSLQHVGEFLLEGLHRLKNYYGFTEKVPILFILFFYSNLKSLQTFDCVVIQYSEK